DDDVAEGLVRASENDDVAAVVAQDFTGDGEAETEADVAGGEERIEGAGGQVGGDAGGGVADADGEHRGAAGGLVEAGAEGDGGFFGTALQAVQDDFKEGVPEALRLAGERSVGKVGGERDGRLDGAERGGL